MPGTGTGRLTAVNISAQPGVEISIAGIDCGSTVITSLVGKELPHTYPSRARSGNRLTDEAGGGCHGAVMRQDHDSLPRPCGRWQGRCA